MNQIEAIILCRACTLPEFLRVICLMILLLYLCMSNVGAAGQTSSQEVDKPSHAIIEIDAKNVVRKFLPDTFFGFNIRWDNFQKDLWDDRLDRVKPQIVDALKPFAGALYRYPGGLVANEYMWLEAIPPMKERKQTNLTRHSKDKLPLFGIGEFFNFVHQVNGTPMYTLNLIGKGKPSNIQEYPINIITENNKGLAEYVKKLTPNSSIRYYQLGNELDRSKYEWSHDKYVTRSLATIQAMSKIDENARFIAFLRDFNWRYRYDKNGVSRYQDFIRDVLTGLPMVNDYSIHIYYDAEIRPGGRFLHIKDAVDRIKETLSIAKKIRNTTPVNVWITEHSRRIQVDQDNEGIAKVLTTNLGGALSTADFLIAMAQIPEVQGTALQALNGVARQVFDASVKHNDLRPRPVYSAMRILNINHSGAVLSTQTMSPNKSGYEGGYDVRATAFTDGPDKLAVWVINRSATETKADIVYTQFQNQAVEMRHYYLAGKSTVNADAVGDDYKLVLEPSPQSSRFSDNGVTEVTLPPSSVSTFLFLKNSTIKGHN